MCVINTKLEGLINIIDVVEKPHNGNVCARFI